MLEEKKLYSRALEKWGKEAQLEKLEEELIEALFAIRMFRTGKGSYDDVREELSDVEIMTNQFKFNDKDDPNWGVIKKIKLHKLERYLNG